MQYHGFNTRMIVFMRDLISSNLRTFHNLITRHPTKINLGPTLPHIPILHIIKPSAISTSHPLDHSQTSSSLHRLIVQLPPSAPNHTPYTILPQLPQ